VIAAEERTPAMGPSARPWPSWWFGFPGWC